MFLHQRSHLRVFFSATADRWRPEVPGTTRCNGFRRRRAIEYGVPALMTSLGIGRALLALWLALVTATGMASSLTSLDDPTEAPSIEALDLDGARRTLGEFSGKVVLVNFWATWCPPCLKELPSMQALWERFAPRDFVMVGVNVGEDANTVVDFLESFGSNVDFTMFLDPDLKIVKKWPVFGLPTTFVVDRAGRIVMKAVGERDWTDPDIEKELIDLIESDGQ
ncbi:MAG: TlpA family protein disulfide reductase [Proteobacteria bacterium]|nr:MAG: TlpA family protein disulfide reductase [Pseudomonadota bacterium]